MSTNYSQKKSGRGMARIPRHIQSTKRSQQFSPWYQSSSFKGEVIINYQLLIINY
ncbi:MAG: hypothetical protein WBA93_11845 [Microcoleaceae cyanobacterium]